MRKRTRGRRYETRPSVLDRQKDFCLLRMSESEGEGRVSNQFKRKIVPPNLRQGSETFVA